MADKIPRHFTFFRNGDPDASKINWDGQVDAVRQAIAEAMNAKNVAFLLGAGCSSLVKDGQELGIPTMAPLAKEFCGSALAALATSQTSEESADLISTETDDDLENKYAEIELDVVVSTEQENVPVSSGHAPTRKKLRLKTEHKRGLRDGVAMKSLIFSQLDDEESPDK